MKVLVLGAGVIGATTAYHLAEAGHQVVVLDRQSGAGLETSFANGGQISPCHAEPWANPGVLPKVLKWLGREDAPLLFRWNRFDPALWAWGLRFVANCTSARAVQNTERTLRVALYSRACLQELRDRLALDYDQRTQGILHVYRSAREFDQGCRAARLMNQYGLDRQIQDRAQCVAIEPALAAVAPQLAGGILTPGDESGDAHKFTRAMADHAARLGAEFRYGTTVTHLTRDGDTVTGTATDRGVITADAVVLALGSWSPLLSRPAGIRLPVVPAKGYSITLAADGPAAPTVSVTDDEHKMVYSRLGDRLRAAGTAEMAGHDPSLNERRWRLIVERARALFPGAGDFDHVEPWAGLRPVTPDSVPLIGRTRLRGLWLNTGHGTLGWTMACGSARLLAQLMGGQSPDIDPTGLGIERFKISL
ncbi:D-amino acid dehydrogenase [Magnetospirillum sp. 64-120]|uniref:D-amino acid dehydrogenase n=1 Tax=Magnetospirillum sp. 64-120 TaxID=1895778 RepID=UPI0009291634|nr:D-amino acid dehydrogenase [Magnetospirillum sp. 64-120]OJX80926.1 MAG: amino acid dehydrogenase [Magnetospirillum sp. 64-120]